MRLLLINGINTAFGGSGKNLLNNWLDNFSKNTIEVSIYNTVPTFGLKNKNKTLYLIFFLFFFPGLIFSLF